MNTPDEPLHDYIKDIDGTRYVLTRFATPRDTLPDIKAAIIMKFARQEAQKSNMRIDAAGLYIHDAGHNRYVKFTPGKKPVGGEQVYIRLLAKEGARAAQFPVVEQYVSVQPVITADGAMLDALLAQHFPKKPTGLARLKPVKRTGWLDDANWRSFDAALCQNLDITVEDAQRELSHRTQAGRFV